MSATALAPTFALSFTRTSDMELVRRIMATPALYRAIAGDDAPTVEDFVPTVHELIWYVLCHDSDECIGCFVFCPETGATWQVHTCLLPIAPMVRGRSLAAAKGVIEWIFANTSCERIITRVPDFNRLALRFALHSGLKAWGYNEMSFRKNGKLHGQTYLGISKPGGG